MIASIAGRDGSSPGRRRTLVNDEGSRRGRTKILTRLARRLCSILRVGGCEKFARV